MTHHCFQKETRVSNCVDNQHLLSDQHSKRKFYTLSIAGYKTFLLRLSHHHITAVEIHTVTYPQKILSTQPWVFNIKQKRKRAWQPMSLFFSPSLGYRDLKCIKTEEETFTEPISQKLQWTKTARRDKTDSKSGFFPKIFLGQINIVERH